VGAAASCVLGCRARSDGGSSVAVANLAPADAEAPRADAADVSDTAPGTGQLEPHMLDFPSSPVGPERALALVPRSRLRGEKLPVLVALHGRGEAVRGIDVGARAWRDDYWVDRAFARLLAPPLTGDAFQGFVQPERLRRINASLAERPFRGVIVVCPWVPDLLTESERGRLDAALPFGTFVVEHLLPAVTASLPASAERRATGIDGVSLGGRVALVAGLAHGDRLGAVGSLQAAVQPSELPSLVDRARRASREAGELHLRLVTSERDYFRAAIVQLHELLDEARVENEHLLVPGPHDYVWNRGPGAIEMLLWHDRVLRGEPPL
jgi:hypothetical protein